MVTNLYCEDDLQEEMMEKLPFIQGGRFRAVKQRGVHNRACGEKKSLVPAVSVNDTISTGTGKSSQADSPVRGSAHESTLTT